MNPTRPRPLVPSDLDPSRALTRAITAHCLVVGDGPKIGSPAEIVAAIWPNDLIARSAASVIGTNNAGSIQPSVIGSFLAGLQRSSAAARLISEGVRISLDGVATVSIPRATTNPQPTFVDEGAPIPVQQAVLTAGATLGPAKKLGLIQVLTSELSERADNAETVIRTLMVEAASAALDSAIFSTAAASSSRPAGILSGVALTATAGGGLAAFMGDVKQLIDSITLAGGGSRLMLFMPPSKAAIVGIYAPAFDIEIVPTPVLAPATVVAIDPQGFASGFGSDPQIDISREATIHMDSSPTAIGTPGSPNVVAAPVRNLYQTNSIGLRLILKCAWTMRAPGLIQFVQNVTW